MTATPTSCADVPLESIALTEPAHDQMVEMIHTLWPGGRYAAPHYADGPHHLVCVRSIRKPPHAAELVLRAYRRQRVTLPFLESVDDGRYGNYETVLLYPLPDVPARILSWDISASRLNVDEDFGLADLPAPAGPADWAAAIGRLLTWETTPLPALTPVLEAVIAAHGIQPVAALLCALTPEVLFRPDQVATALTGTFST